MSHSHTHAPGETHTHSHGPQQSPPPPQFPTPDPALQALIEQDFRPVDVILGAPNDTVALCGTHSMEKCAECGIDYVNLNRLTKILASNPTLLCPPPATVVSQNLTQAVTNVKEEGNTYFKMNQHEKALSRYTQAASIAVQRPPWEANKVMREELSAIVSNRSAAALEMGDFIGALVDAEIVIELRRDWAKGHFRKAKALLGMHRLKEAQSAIRLGLQWEPNNTELNSFLAEIEKVDKRLQEKKLELRYEKYAELVNT